MTDEVLRLARDWIADDPDPETRAELQALIDAHDLESLRERFSTPLTFGTAGIRGLIGAGPARMNRSVVARVTHALCDHLVATIPDARERGVCVGFDGRRMSTALRDETLSVILGAGFRAYGFATVVPTPVLAHAVTQVGASAGVMITASHNPPEYNGYKAYGSHGAQIVPPDDREIEARASTIASVGGIKRIKSSAASAEQLRWIDDHVHRHYQAALRDQVRAVTARSADVRIAYTALHGVGEASARAALHNSGFDDVHSVEEQAEPDGAFPTVRFPNPEEPQAMERVLALADTVEADLALANDPDADRLAVAARDRDGTMRTLTGNQVGLLLTEFLLRHCTDTAHACVLTSLVTTPMAETLTRAYGVHWEATLTGTKWICHRALALEHTEGLRMVIGFEEALGYCIGDNVRDKDGIAAAVYMALLASEAKTRGQSVHDEWETLCRRHGLSASRQRSINLSGADATERVTSLLRAWVASPPATMGEVAVDRVVDLSAGTTLPPTPGVVFQLAGQRRICIRPSGTEPKLKCYLDVTIAVTKDEPFRHAEVRAEHALDEMASALDAML